MDLSILSRNKVSLMTLDEKYLPTAIVLPFEGHARQSKLMHAQVLKCSDIYLDLWVQIINRKVSNQARALSIMGMNGAENISKYLESITAENVDITEALAAKEYFSYYHEGLNRRIDDPINSRLNYGYAVIRSYIAKIWEFFDNLNEAVYVVDMDTHELIYLNKKVMNTYNLHSMDEIVGKKCYEFLPACNAPCALCNIDALEEGKFIEWQHYNPMLNRFFILRIAWLSMRAGAAGLRLLLTTAFTNRSIRCF